MNGGGVGCIKTLRVRLQQLLQPKFEYVIPVMREGVKVAKTLTR